MVHARTAHDKTATVADLAQKKHLDPAWLAEIAVEDIPGGGVRIHYFDDAGNPLFARERDRPSGPRFRQPAGTKLVPYGLWRLGDARRAALVYIAEGESDCWALWASGFPALGLPGASAAGSLRADHIEDIETIYILGDNDKAGARMVAAVRKRLRELRFGGTVYSVPVPPAHKDASDWRCADVEGFAQAVRSATYAAVACRLADRPTTAEPTTGPAEDDDHLTDLGNARRVLRLHGEDLRYSHARNLWYVWDGTRWKDDETGEINRRVKDTIRRFYADAANEIGKLAESEGDEKTARVRQLKKCLSHACRWEAASAVRHCIEQMRSEPGVPVVEADLDKDPMLLTVANGTIDLRTGTLREHRRGDLCAKLAPVAYDPDAKCPQWESAILRWMGGNVRMADYIQRVIGYSLTGDVSEQVVFLLHGSGANGKSTLLEVVLGVMGDYASPAPPELLLP